MIDAEKLKYFEIELSNGDADSASWMCIRGTDQPTIDEAQIFLNRDSEKLSLPVAGVYPIDEQTARGCYDFDNESAWPIFRKGHLPEHGQF